MLMIAGVRAAQVVSRRAYTVERVSARPDPGLFTSHYLIRQKSSTTLLAGAAAWGSYLWRLEGLLRRERSSQVCCIALTECDTLKSKDDSVDV
jgi:hypothetical protein